MTKSVAFEASGGAVHDEVDRIFVSILLPVRPSSAPAFPTYTWVHAFNIKFSICGHKLLISTLDNKYNTVFKPPQAQWCDFS